ncbi:ubiquitin-associated protein 2-like isoform X4 [Carassius gibelio]|uniref:ubiquitin-associated protein 2-like isoform X4 n=1 Tax=Carassius gibelio TaxID=101364 RepID=UPI0022790716|nr:ubiquitin-associated protein 2-like isoform X4 [Carassius gibelio]XP_052388648.1 ubiquitin-associated protein 2-like isoform X4 [Carassius gibelio]
MMTSVGGSRARGNWEQTQGQTPSQSQHKQRPQATAEQIRLAQMISDHNDADFEEKVKQLVDITGKDQDESMIALHDCNGDVNRAINVLLEGSPDTDSWEMVGKKKGVSGQKESTQTDGGDEGKENREKGGERDVARRRGGAPRRGRGASRGREFRGQENGLDGAKAGGVAGRGMERGRRGRGRGRGGAGRRGGRFSAQGMGTFNPADYTEPTQTEESYTSGSTWSNTGNLEPEDGNRLEFTGGEGTNYPRKFDSAPGAWRTATEEWGMEDWNEDLSETKIFTASSVASMPIPQENVTITAGQRIDLAVLLGKTPPSSSSEAEPASLEGPQPPSLSQSLVFSSSKQTASMSQSSSSAPYSQHSMVSMLTKGFGDVGDPKGTTGGSTTGSQFLEQFKTAQALAQLVAQHSQSSTPSAGASTWDTSPPTLGQYDMKPQTEPVHSPFTKRQPYKPTSTSSSMDAFLQDKATPASTTSAMPPQSTPSSSSSSLPHATITTPLPKPSGPSPGQQNSSSPADPQASSPLPLQQHKLKQQKKRASISTKIPALAVEMPGSADISGLNLQFGALQFGSEPVLPEYDASAAVATTTPGIQGQNSLYTSASNEQATALSNPSQMELYEPRASQTRRYPTSVSSSPQKDIQSKNGFNSMQTSQSLEAAAGSAVPVKPVSESVVPSSVSNISSLTDPSSGPPSLLTTSSQTPLSALGHEDGLPGSLAPPQHNNPLPSQQSSLAPSSVRTSNSSLLHQSVDGDSSLHSSSFSSVSVAPSVPPPSLATSAAPVSHTGPIPPSSSVSSVSAQSALGPGSSLTLGLNSGAGVVSMVPPTAAASSSSAALATAAPSSALSRSTAASGKAPPNLPPGVPPLLPNPYIMAPGLLHPYPPQMYGYDDLQMLQTRIPLDYYSIPFATPTTALTGREGSLTSNPYSAGDLSKFGRGDASSPAPATTLAQPQQTQTQTHHTTQQPFLNPALPPGYSYTSLPYYTGVPGLPNTFQYGPAMFPVAPTSSKQHGVNVGVNASATAFQQASGYGSHGYSTGVSVTSSNTGVPDISGSVYTKTQSFEKQGFHTGTPSASFSLPSALGSAGPINPTAAAGYAPAPYMHILTPHQQPHSQMLHHHLQQDGQSGSGQRNQNASIQQKSQINKSGYNSYNWGGN